MLRKILGYCIALSPLFVAVGLGLWKWGAMASIILCGATMAAVGCILIWMWGVSVVIEED